MEIEKKWREINDGWLKSGLPQKKYCQKSNISYSKFTAMRSSLIRSGLSLNTQPKSLQEKKSHVSPAFIPIKMSDQSKTIRRYSSTIEVYLPHGIILRIPADEKCSPE